MYQVVFLIFTFAATGTFFGERPLGCLLRLQPPIVNVVANDMLLSHGRGLARQGRRISKTPCRTNRNVRLGSGHQTPNLIDAFRPPETLTCSIESIKWNTAAENVEIAVCWANTSGHTYLCLESDLCSGISFRDSENTMVSIPANFSRRTKHDVASVLLIRPGESVHRRLSFPYFLRREASGRVFVELLLGISGKADLSLGETYSIQQTARSTCSLAGESLVFMEGTPLEREMSTSEFSARYGTWVSGEVGRRHHFKVPCLNSFGKSPQILEWPSLINSEDLPPE